MITLFVCGDVMTGRGVDQILPSPGDPRIFESYVRSAEDYVTLAERTSGAIPRAVPFDYIWGDALEVWERVEPDARIINLETAVTAGGDPELAKGINYRMHPANVHCLTAAGIDCCVLANNHVLDWGTTGLADTLDVLEAAGLATAGAGRNQEEAAAPAVIDVGSGQRVLVFAWGLPSAGVPRRWQAGPARPGVNRLPDLSPRSAEAAARIIDASRRPQDIVVASIHWGGNWGFEITRAERAFAHFLIEHAGVDVVHGHSSHHVRGIEVWRDRPILYGCGDFLNDYEGIKGYEEFRGDLGLMYFPSLERATGRLVGLAMVPTTIERFRIRRASPEGVGWLTKTLDREGQNLGTSVTAAGDEMLNLAWVRTD